MIINLIPTNGTVLLTLIYLEPVERPEAYAPFYALTPVFEQTGFMTLFTPDSKLYGELAALYSTDPEVAAISALQAGTVIAAVQPVSASAVWAGRESNDGTGNELGLQAVNQTCWTVTVSWWNAEDDEAAYAAAASLARKIRAAAVAAGASLEYIFMNDANFDQPVIAWYGEANVRRLRAVQQRAYDPGLVFQNLVRGGQKIPQ
ncbi:Uu.00g031490.m01.CDS01 [Anthostomella pinea]|uniref:Uu.00g031490.m01.CDS01 n=1 Tax=Anthostomella pinea TaxID=933095 RepID=A0AAI8YD01_9PEZI|nr:Uu.00g031490.m01.CDS01 [Anthostomella pinea]